MDFKPVVELMKACIEKYGMWPTVGAIGVLTLFICATAIAWRLPEILQALK